MDDVQHLAVEHEAVSCDQRFAGKVDFADLLALDIDPEEAPGVHLNGNQVAAVLGRFDPVEVDTLLVLECGPGEVEPAFSLLDTCIRRNSEENRPAGVGDVGISSGGGDDVVEEAGLRFGRSEGAEVVFAIDGHEEQLEVFTTRPDTLFGATYCVLAPEHQLVEQITTSEQFEAVNAYQEQAARKNDLERTDLAKE
jgi:hypothetical protein